MTELSRHPKQSTEQLFALDGEYASAHAAIMRNETLPPQVKARHLEELKAEYREKRILATGAARKDLSEWSEIFQSRAERAWEPKMPENKDARILQALELQRLSSRIELLKDNPGALLREYQRAVRAGNHIVAYELEETLPTLLPEDARRDFGRQRRENRLARMSDADRRKVEEAEAFEKERATVEQGLGLQETARNGGYLPEEQQPNMIERGRRGPGPEEVYEMPNPSWRGPAGPNLPPASQPRGGVIGPDPGQGQGPAPAPGPGPGPGDPGSAA
jgi:hypothetical protein